MILPKCYTQYAGKIGKLSGGHRTGKGQFSFQYQRQQCQRIFKICTIVLISHVSKIKPKIIQVRLQQHVNLELPDVKARFRKGRRIRDWNASIRWNTEKAREIQKTITSISLTMLVFDCVDHNSCGKFLKRWEYQITLPDNRESQE